MPRGIVCLLALSLLASGADAWDAGQPVCPAVSEVPPSWGPVAPWAGWGTLTPLAVPPQEFWGAPVPLPGEPHAFWGTPTPWPWPCPGGGLLPPEPSALHESTVSPVIIPRLAPVESSADPSR